MRLSRAMSRTVNRKDREISLQGLSKETVPRRLSACYYVVLMLIVHHPSAMLNVKATKYPQPFQGHPYPKKKNTHCPIETVAKLADLEL